MRNVSTPNNAEFAGEGWTMVIRPKRSLFELNLKEIWRYRDLIFLFVKRDFVAKYKQTILGPLWFILQPLLTTLMFTVVFGKIAGIPTEGLPNILFYMAGIVGWNYFSTCLNDTSATFITNASIFGKVYFPRMTLPVSIVISSLITFVIQFVFLIAFMIYYYLRGVPIHIGAEILLVPILVILMAGLGLGFGIIISSLTTKYRDLLHLVKFGVQLWMYATPIIYPLSEIPEKYKIYVLANPMTPVIETFKTAMLGVGQVNYIQLLYSAGFMVIILAIGIVVFNKVEKNFMDTV
ncbi:MAG: ABC transporter permease [Bacteroidetes bacterium]|nr:ABC transporter permease [Bacteroidota bacterium]